MTDNIEFKAEVDKMYLAMNFLVDLNLIGIADTVQYAHTLGPFIDPTKYRDALNKGHMDDAARMASALLEPVKMFREIKEKMGVPA